jgi:hypothetical protein
MRAEIYAEVTPYREGSLTAVLSARWLGAYPNYTQNQGFIKKPGRFVAGSEDAIVLNYD